MLLLLLLLQLLPLLLLALCCMPKAALSATQHAVMCTLHSFLS
jgi:hypothetical protein